VSNSDRYIEFVRKWLGHRPDALAWICAYGIYCHAIDDIIDGDKTDSEHVLKTFELAAVIYMNDFCRQYAHILYPLVIMASNTYRDSVILEKAEEEWKRKVADALRQTGNEVVLAVIEIAGGVEARREASLELREISWFTHHTLEGKPC
jgi:hypothetical protein